jgi:hypothetical protein
MASVSNVRPGQLSPRAKEEHSCYLFSKFIRAASQSTVLRYTHIAQLEPIEFRDISNEERLL